MVNAAMTTLESAFARSSYNTAFERKLQQHEQQVLKRRRKQQIAQDLGKKAAAIAQKTKKPATSASGSAKGASSSTTAQASTNDKASAQKPKEMQQEQHANKEPSVTKPSKTEAKTSKAGEEKTETKEPAKTEEKSSPKWWDVGGFQVKQFKHWITVRLERGSIRIFFQGMAGWTGCQGSCNTICEASIKKVHRISASQNQEIESGVLDYEWDQWYDWQRNCSAVGSAFGRGLLCCWWKRDPNRCSTPPKGEAKVIYIFLVVKGLAVPVTKSLQVLFSMI